METRSRSLNKWLRQDLNPGHINAKSTLLTVGAVKTSCVLGTVLTAHMLPHFIFTEKFLRWLCCYLHLQRRKLRLGSHTVDLTESANLIPDFNFGTSVWNSQQCLSAQQECHAAIINGYQFWKDCHQRQIIGILQAWMEYSIQENSLVDEKKH